MAADWILANRFYRVLSTELPGAHEFIACEHLQHLASSGRLDLVVLDTPPTQNALDFLDAPSRILGVLDNEAFRFFADNPSSASPDATKQVHSGLVNLIYNVTPKLEVGIEALHAQRKVEGGAEGSMDRLQVMAKHSF